MPSQEMCCTACHGWCPSAGLESLLTIFANTNLSSAALRNALDSCRPLCQLEDVVLSVLSVLEGEGRADTSEAVTFATDGKVEIIGALSPGTTRSLLEYVTCQFLQHVRKQHARDEQLKLRAHCHTSVQGILAGEQIDDDVLWRAVDMCAPHYRVGEAVLSALRLIEEDDQTLQGLVLEECKLTFDPDADEEMPMLFDGDIVAEHDESEAQFRKIGKARFLFKVQICDLPVSAAMREIVPRLEPMLQATLGPDCILVEVGALVVELNSPPQKLHSDVIWTPGPEVVAVFVALQDVESDMAPTMMLPRTHDDPWYWLKAIKGADSHRLAEDPAYLQDILGTPPLHACELRAGSAVCMDSRLLHFGGTNSSTKRRVVWYLTFVKSGVEDEDLSKPAVGVDPESGPGAICIQNTLVYRKLTRSVSRQFGDLVTLPGLMEVFSSSEK